MDLNKFLEDQIHQSTADLLVTWTSRPANRLYELVGRDDFNKI